MPARADQRRPAAARRFFYICFAPRAAATVDNPVGMPYYGGWEYTHTNFGGNADEIAEDEPTLASDRLRHGGGLRDDLPGAHGPRGGRRGVGCAYVDANENLVHDESEQLITACPSG